MNIPARFVNGDLGDIAGGLFRLLFDQSLQFPTERQSGIVIALELPEQRAKCGLLNFQSLSASDASFKRRCNSPETISRVLGFGLLRFGFRSDMLLRTSACRTNVSKRGIFRNET
jgi:hypothetical protein